MYIAPDFDFVRAYRKIIRFSHTRVQNIGDTSLWPYFSTTSCQIVNYPVFEKQGAECRFGLLSAEFFGDVDSVGVALNAFPASESKNSEFLNASVQKTRSSSSNNVLVIFLSALRVNSNFYKNELTNVRYCGA